MRQRIPARTGKQHAIGLIGQLGIGDGDLAKQIGAPGRIVEQADPLFDGGVGAADEKAGYAGNFAEIAVGCAQIFQPADIGFNHLAVGFDREQQGDIDIDPFADDRTDRRQPRVGRGNLDHQVGPVDGLPQPYRLGDGALRVIGQIGRAFEADIAVARAGPVIDRAQHIGGGANVGDCQVFIDRVDAGRAAGGKRLDRCGIFIALANRLLKDRGIGRQPHQAVAFDHPRKIAAFDEAAFEIVDPHRLAGSAQSLERVRLHSVHAFASIVAASCCRAAASTASGVKPNFAIRSLIGADEPRVCMPMIAPVEPT